MKFNKHFDLEGKHAFLGASQSAWIRYDLEKLRTRWINDKAKQEGTELHALAQVLIDKKIKLPKSRKTLNAYVNDAIGYGMETEVVLVYSDHIFGTADAIKYDERKKFLRIHDLKTGESGHMEQLMIYAALFCLEYSVKPADIEIELRLYKQDDVLIYRPEPKEILTIIDKMVTFDNYLDKLIEEEGV